jgi:hypothetical protein
MMVAGASGASRPSSPGWVAAQMMRMTRNPENTSVTGLVSEENRWVRITCFLYRLVCESKPADSRSSSPYDRISRMAERRSVIVAVTSPRSLLRARACRRRLRTSRWSSMTSNGTKASVNRVRRIEIWLSTASVTITTTRFWNRETSDAVMTVLVWSTSVIMAAITWPARVRWKNPRSRVSR